MKPYFPAIPMKEAQTSSHVAIIVTARGGHIGFLEGWWPISAKEQYMAKLFSEYFSKALIDKDGEFEKVSKILMEQYKKKHSNDQIPQNDNGEPNQPLMT